jgi:hypothetical protein
MVNLYLPSNQNTEAADGLLLYIIQKKNVLAESYYDIQGYDAMFTLYFHKFHLSFIPI